MKSLTIGIAASLIFYRCFHIKSHNKDVQSALKGKLRRPSFSKEIEVPPAIEKKKEAVECFKIKKIVEPKRSIDAEVFMTLKRIIQGCYIPLFDKDMTHKLYLYGSKISESFYCTPTPEACLCRMAILVKQLNIDPDLFKAYLEQNQSDFFESLLRYSLNDLKDELKLMNVNRAYHAKDLDFALLINEENPITKLKLFQLSQRIVEFCKKEKEIELKVLICNISDKEPKNHFMMIGLTIKDSVGNLVEIDLSLKNQLKTSFKQEVDEEGMFFPLKEINPLALLNDFKESKNPFLPLVKTCLRLREEDLWIFLSKIEEEKLFSKLSDVSLNADFINLTLNKILNGQNLNDAKLSKLLFILNKNQELELKIDRQVMQWFFLLQNKSKIEELLLDFKLFCEALIERQEESDHCLKVWFACFAMTNLIEVLNDIELMYDFDKFQSLWKENKESLNTLYQLTKANIQDCFEITKSKPKCSELTGNKETNKSTKKRKTGKEPIPRLKQRRQAEEVNKDSFIPYGETMSSSTLLTDLDVQLLKLNNRHREFCENMAKLIYSCRNLDDFNMKKSKPIINFLKNNQVFFISLNKALNTLQKLLNRLDPNNNEYELTLEFHHKEIKEKTNLLVYYWICALSSTKFFEFFSPQSLDFEDIFECSINSYFFNQSKVNLNLSKNNKEILFLIYDKEDAFEQMLEASSCVFFNYCNDSFMIGKVMMSCIINSKFEDDRSDKYPELFQFIQLLKKRPQEERRYLLDQNYHRFKSNVWHIFEEESREYQLDMLTNLICFLYSKSFESVHSQWKEAEKTSFIVALVKKMSQFISSPIQVMKRVFVMKQFLEGIDCDEHARLIENLSKDVLFLKKGLS